MSLRTVIHQINYKSGAAAVAGLMIAAGLCALLIPAVLTATAPQPAESAVAPPADAG